jgi:Peptidase S24-like
LKSLRDKPALHKTSDQELAISGVALLEIMQGVLAKGALFRFRATGWSMSPFIRDGDVITIAPLGLKKPALGQVVAFIRPEFARLAVHRVIGRQGPKVLIQGDNIADQADGWFLPQHILGRVMCIERNGKRVWLGLGLERYLIVFFSRIGLLVPLLNRIRLFKGMIMRCM